MSRRNGLLLLDQGGVDSVQVSNSRVAKKTHRLEYSHLCFTVGLIRCGIIPVCLLTYTLLLLPEIPNLDS